MASIAIVVSQVKGRTKEIRTTFVDDAKSAQICRMSLFGSPTLNSVCLGEEWSALAEEREGQRKNNVIQFG